MLRSALEILAWSNESTSKNVATHLSKIQSTKDDTIDSFVDIEFI